MYTKKVEIPGVNTTNLKTLTNEEMIELRRQFEEDYSSGATDMYDKILQTAKDNRDQERAIEDENYAEKLEKFGAYSDSWFEAQNTTKKEFIEGLK